MGPKKRNIVTRSKSSQTSVPAPAPEAESSDQYPNAGAITLVKSGSVDSEIDFSNGNPNSSYALVKLECERSLTALRRGNHTRALRLMKDLCSKHENSPHSALIHRVQGTVCVKVASIIDDQNAKNRYLRNAVDSARRAVSLSPNSMEFTHFYANLLYETASEGRDYEEVMHECERALSIENPVDPAKESLQEENQQKISTAEGRIAHVQSELQALIQKANIASISTWMKNLSNGDDKFRLIPIRRAPEDPMELTLVQTRRPNEIKKATKTPEERRKEIEVRVAAARLLQQKSEANGLGNEGGDCNDGKGLDSGPVSGHRAGERRKSGNVRKNATSSERRDSVRLYWNTMSLDKKKDLLRIKISDLKAYFSSSKDRSASEVLDEALSFGEMNEIWKFWMCCRCNEKFSASGSFMLHVVHHHLDSLSAKMESILPQNVDNEWAEMLLNCSWKPLELNAAIKMLEKQSKSEEPDFFDEYEWDPSPGEKRSGDTCNGDSRDNTEIEDIEWMDCDGDEICKENSQNENWPLSDDPERSKLLEKIHAVFKVLIEHKYLASSHLNKVIHFAMDELHSLACGSHLLNSDMDQSPSCICLLGAPELKKILNFLQEISHTCGLNRHTDKSNATGHSKSEVQGVETVEKIRICRDDSFLVLDEHFLAVNNDSSAATVDSDALLSWIFAGPSSGEQLASWAHLKEEKAQQGVEIIQSLEKELYNLQGLCERKSEHLNYEEALQAVEDLCLEEAKSRENVTDFVHRSYDSALRKRREELVQNDAEITIISSKFELDAISNVLKDAESLNVNQFGFEETYNGAASHLESGEVGDWRTKDYLNQLDSCVEVAIQRQKEQVSIEISKIDARIMRVVIGMQQLEARLELSSAHDFRTILIPLVKSFMRTRLEELAEKDATEKSDAAREAFLAELALDSKEGTSAGFDVSKHVSERTKDRKKSKENRKNKDPKATNYDESDNRSTEEILVPSDDPSSEIHVFDEALRLQEEEQKRQIELEADERMLEETLEYQRRLENEAKLKQLAEQHKLISEKSMEKEEIIAISDTYSRHTHNDDDENAMEQCTDSKKETLTQKDGLPNVLEGVAKNASNGNMIGTGLPHGDISERRSGRRNRRYKGLSKLNDGKEASEVDPVQTAQGDVDNGAKTLRQLQTEKDDEERFQADLKKAVRQSLDTFHARKRVPSKSNSAMPHEELLETNNSCFSCEEAIEEGANETDAYGTGLKNEVGEYNCFLNVIIQSLWHLRRFRDEFLRRSLSQHVHIGEPCVICALHNIFVALSMASKDNKREAVAPTSLRIALNNLYPDSNFYQEGQMNDASEILGVIFNCLHRSFTPADVASDTDSVDSNCTGSWDCSNASCIAHSIFGMDIFERMNCYNCRLESRYLKYTSFFHNINASALRTMKVMCPENSFEELLNLVEMNHQLACDPEAGGCGKLNYIHHILSTPPHVFTTVLGWQNTSESVEDITATLAALSTKTDISVLYRGLDPKNSHALVSVVCYYGQHYHCFAYSRDHEQWIMYDDKTVKVIGGWNDVITMCERGHLQPQVLLFEAVN